MQNMKDDILRERKKCLGKSLSISYESDEPLLILKGKGQYLYDEQGKQYLDCVNNVAHVGHSHPKVIEAAMKQFQLLNTNTRYLHPNLVKYAKELTSKMPKPLSVCYFVCSGSEANDLALRLARNYTKKNDVVVLDGAYHGNLSSLVEISPYKYERKGGFPQRNHVHKAIAPDTYRGMYSSTDPQAGKKYASDIKKIIDKAKSDGRSIAAFFAESVMGCRGQIVLPDGYLQEAYKHAHDNNILCVADEVQIGFGRVGTHFWGFETQGVVPDIVTLGKPIGNGFPMAAVVTTAEISERFHNGMEYFNTFGGCTVACAVGNAVLKVIQEENLQFNAMRVGKEILDGAKFLKGKYGLIGDVRGIGLFIGIELVKDRNSLRPADSEATWISNRMKQLGVLISTDGPYNNVLKLKPPMCITSTDAQFIVKSLDQALHELTGERFNNTFQSKL